jgi:hypothetical protein
MATVLTPPSGPKDRGDASKLGWQRVLAADGAVTLVVVEPPHATASAHAPIARTKRQCETRRRTCARDAYPSPAWIDESAHQ